MAVALQKRRFTADDRATQALVRAVGEQAVVQVQGPVRLDLYHEPQPDLVLLRPRSDYYASRLPGPPAGVPEYWVADLTAACLWCFSMPGNGVYAETLQRQRGETLSPHGLAMCVLQVDHLLAD